jgi:acyl-CoA thioester hydrolase
MAKIILDSPASYAFTTEIPLRITDVNYGGHVGNDSILSILHEARARFLSKGGFTELNAAGVGLIMSDCTIEFRSELFYGERLLASVAAKTFSRVGFSLFYQLEKEGPAGERRLVVLARTGMVCFRYEEKKICTLPEQLRIRLETL